MCRCSCSGLSPRWESVSDFPFHAVTILKFSLFETLYDTVQSCSGKLLPHCYRIQFLILHFQSFNAPALLFSSIYFLRSSDYDSGYDSLLMFILVLLTPARAIARRLGLMLIIVLAVAVSVAMTMTIADSMM